MKQMEKHCCLALRIFSGIFVSGHLLLGQTLPHPGIVAAAVTDAAVLTILHSFGIFDPALAYPPCHIHGPPASW
jgi:hypothetical protein